jgi:hypothetical protein
MLVSACQKGLTFQFATSDKLERTMGAKSANGSMVTGGGRIRFLVSWGRTDFKPYTPAPGCPIAARRREYACMLRIERSFSIGKITIYYSEQEVRDFYNLTADELQYLVALDLVPAIQNEHKIISYAKTTAAYDEIQTRRTKYGTIYNVVQRPKPRPKEYDQLYEWEQKHPEMMSLVNAKTVMDFYGIDGGELKYLVNIGVIFSKFPEKQWFMDYNELRYGVATKTFNYIQKLRWGSGRIIPGPNHTSTGDEMVEEEVTSTQSEPVPAPTDDEIHECLQRAIFITIECNNHEDTSTIMKNAKLQPNLDFSTWRNLHKKIRKTVV